VSKGQRPWLSRVTCSSSLGSRSFVHQRNETDEKIFKTIRILFCFLFFFKFYLFVFYPRFVFRNTWNLRDAGRNQQKSHKLRKRQTQDAQIYICCCCHDAQSLTCPFKVSSRLLQQLFPPPCPLVWACALGKREKRERERALMDARKNTKCSRHSTTNFRLILISFLSLCSFSGGQQDEGIKLLVKKSSSSSFDTPLIANTTGFLRTRWVLRIFLVFVLILIKTTVMLSVPIG